MARETEVKVEKALEAIKQLQFQMSQVMAAVAAMVETNNGNAVLEGDEIEPKATRNGKLRKVR